LLVACAKTESPAPSFDPPDRDVELAAMQGRWKRGDMGCAIWIDGPHFLETCDDPANLLYGPKTYIVSFPQVGQIRLSEGGSYHDHGYARNGGDIYIGLGGAGVWSGNAVVASPLRRRVLLVMRDGVCSQHRGSADGFESAGVPIACESTRRGDKTIVAFESISDREPGATERIELERIGDSVASSEVARGRLWR
jgi:hypothetical protein